MFKRILVATDGSECAQSAVSHAIALAQCFKATVVAQAVVDIKRLMGPFLQDLGASIGFGNLESYRPQVRRMLVDKANAALDFVEETCRAGSVPIERVLGEGKVPTEIVEQAKFTDLVVMGKEGEHADLSDAILGSTVEAVVRRTNRPVLLSPPKYSPIHTALAAYDGSAYAYEALRALAQMAKGMALSIRLLTVADTAAAAKKTLSRAEAYVRDCGIECETLAREGHAEQVIAAVAKECEADLIAMGAYGHSRIREFIVGSTTEHIMRSADCAFLLYR